MNTTLEDIKRLENTGDGELLVNNVAIKFDETSTCFREDREYNLYFLTAQQAFFNDMLRIRGHVFLNELHDAIGIPRTAIGAIVGWVYPSRKEDGTDTEISFGIQSDPKNNEFFLRPNVQGSIWDLL